jgi:GNAT superfamily N-acetyltransferase
MQIRNHLNAGDLGYIIYLHGVLYAKEYGLDRTFEGYVAAGMGEFVKSLDSEKDFIAIAENEGEIVGSIFINGLPDQTALLRWFLVDPKARGVGLGKRLLQDALEFCRQRKFKSVSLWTIGELTTAAKLYRQAGFKLVEENTREFWGTLRKEQRYDLEL